MHLPRTLAVLTLAVALASTFNATAFAAEPTLKTYPHAASGVSVTFPTAWTVEPLDGDMLIVRAADSAIAVTIMAVPNDALEESLASIKKTLIDDFQGLVLTETQRRKINGMPAVFSDGLGKIEGEDVLVTLLVVVPPKQGQTLVAFAVARKSAPHEHHVALSVALGSFAPLAK